MLKALMVVKEMWKNVKKQEWKKQRREEKKRKARKKEEKEKSLYFKALKFNV